MSNGRYGRIYGTKCGKIAKTIGDGAYDTKSNFQYLASKKIETVIKVRKNASSREEDACHESL